MLYLVSHSPNLSPPRTKSLIEIQIVKIFQADIHRLYNGVYVSDHAIVGFIHGT